MSELLKGLLVGQRAAVWAAGIAIAIAWMSRGWSPLRLAGLAAAVLWPAVLFAQALVAQHAAKSASREFVRLCEQQAHERITRRSALVSSIFVDGGSGMRVDAMFHHFGLEIGSRLVLEQPGYQEIQLIERSSADSKPLVSTRRRGQSHYGGTPAQSPAGEAITRFGVRFEFEGGQLKHPVREFRVVVVDSQTNEVLAEQKSFMYQSRDIAIGGYPLWRRQERTCPLSHPADFVRSVLPPQPM